jgi:uncharacterized membrane protein
MTMKHRQAIICFLLVIATFAGTAWMLPQVPNSIPVHWDMAGHADRMGNRIELFVTPVLMAVLLALWPVLPAISPQRYGIGRFREVWWFVCLAILAAMASMQVLLLAVASGHGVDMARAVPAGLAVLFVLLGNVMGKVKPNFWLGIRTPWTLASERVWYATHRLAAKSMTLAGVTGLVLVACKLPWMTTPVLAAGALWPAAWSLVYDRRLVRAGQHEDS